MAKKTPINVKQPDPPVKKEILAEAIVRIGEAFAALQAGGLNEKAIVVLIADATSVSRADIRLVLDSLRKLKGWYCR